jgi:hypothetical protein
MAESRQIVRDHRRSRGQRECRISLDFSRV